MKFVNISLIQEGYLCSTSNYKLLFSFYEGFIKIKKANNNWIDLGYLHDALHKMNIYLFIGSLAGLEKIYEEEFDKRCEEILNFVLFQ